MRTIAVFMVTVVALCAAPVHAQDKIGTAGATFLTIPPSARHWGLGWAGSAVVDPFVVQLNPGGLGVLSLQPQIVGVRNGQDWNPLTSDLDIRHNNTLLLIGVPLAEPPDGKWPRIALAAAFQQQTLRTDGIPVATYQFPPGIHGASFGFMERSRNLSLALGIEKGIEVGVGTALKRVSLEYEEESTSATARDFGIFARMPVFDVLRELGLSSDVPMLGRVRPEIEILTSYAWANRGEISFLEDTFPFPRLNRFGRSIRLQLSMDHANLLSFLATRDNEIFQLTDSERRHEGWEIGLLGIVQYQQGNTPALLGMEIHGLSFHAVGLFQWASILRESAGKTRLPHWLESLDIFFRTASVEDSSDSPLRGTRFTEFGIALNPASFRQR